MIDLHCHILPGVDDGPQDWQTSIRMAQYAAANGTRIIVATPHHKNGTFVNDVHTIKSLTSKLNDKLQKHRVNVTVLPGSEPRCYPEFVTDVQRGHVLTLNDTQYVYMELPFHGIPHYVEHIVSQLLSLDYVPIIPHPERNSKIRENPNILNTFISNGGMIQVTATSLVGGFGQKIKKFSLDLFKHRLAHVVASDAHGITGKRQPRLREALQVIEKHLGKTMVEQCISYTESIIRGEKVRLEPPLTYKAKKWFVF